MRKSILLCFAAVAMMFTACGNNTENNQTETTASNIEAEATANDNTGNEATNTNDGAGQEYKAAKFEGTHFTLDYPESFKVTYQSTGTFNAKSEDGKVKLDATYNDMGPTIDQLKEYANNYIGMMKNGGSTVEEPKIDGKNLTIKSVKDEIVNMHYVVLKEDEIGVTGSLKYPENKSSECEALLKNIMNSITFK